MPKFGELNVWCTCRKAEAASTLDSYKHKNNLPVAVIEQIKPIFVAVTENELKRCLDGHNLNPNESFMVWRFCPTNSFAFFKTVNLTVSETICVYNAGDMSRISILENLGIVTNWGRCELQRIRISDFSSMQNSDGQRTDTGMRGNFL